MRLSITPMDEAPGVDEDEAGVRGQKAMRLIITDVTEMHGGNYCVAGWKAQGQRMVRPLPNGANSTAGLLQQHGIAPGASIDVFPHRTTASKCVPASHGRYARRSGDHPACERRANRLVRRGCPLTYGTVSGAFFGHIAHNSIWNNICSARRRLRWPPDDNYIGRLGSLRLR